MSEFTIDKWYSSTAKIQGIVNVDAVLEGVYFNKAQIL